MISTQPSVDDLLDRLQDEHQRMSSLRRGLVHGVPRPPLLVRLLLVVCVGLIAAVAWLIGVVGIRAVQVADMIRAKRATEAAAEIALPSGEELLQDGKFRTALIRHPQAAARLHAAKGRELLAKGRAPEAVSAFATARMHAVTPLPGGALVDEIEALVAAGNKIYAQQRLRELDLAMCDPADRERAIGMLLVLSESGHQPPDISTGR